MTETQQQTLDGKIIKGKKEIKKCPYCSKELIYLDNRHYNSCKEYQDHEKKIKIEKKKSPQITIDRFFEIIKRQSYPIDVIYPNDWNVNVMSVDEFNKLKESIRITKGEYLKKIPIQIRKIREDYYEIIDGEHRWRASKELGFTYIPAIVEENVNIEETKTLNVIQSSNRGKIDHFKFSKLLNQEYLDEYGKKKCTQQELAIRFGLSGKQEISNILNIYPRLKNIFEKSGVPDFFSNRQLNALARCKNDLLREKLIEQSIKEEWTSKEIRKHATKLNKISKFLKSEFLQKTRECIFDIFSGDFLFKHNFDEFIDKVFQLIVDNKRKDKKTKKEILFRSIIELPIDEPLCEIIEEFGIPIIRIPGKSYKIRFVAIRDIKKSLSFKKERLNYPMKKISYIHSKEYIEKKAYNKQIRGLTQFILIGRSLGGSPLILVSIADAIQLLSIKQHDKEKGPLIIPF